MSKGNTVVQLVAQGVVLSIGVTTSHGFLIHSQNSCILLGAVHRVPAVASE